MCYNELLFSGAGWLFCRWLNRKVSGSKYLFHVGFLGMDNVSCVDRSKLPSDCTAIDQVISVVLHD